MRTEVQETAEGIRSKVTEKFEAAKSSALGTVEAIKEGIRERFEAAKTVVSEAIEKIKGFMHFEWSLPKLKLPHFTLTGSFSLNPPSIPKIGVEWYAKAMTTPRILTGATIFGAANGRLLGAGEAGSEIVAGAETLMRMIRSAVSTAGQRPGIQIASNGICINVYPTPGMDENALAQKVLDRLGRELAVEGV